MVMSRRQRQQEQHQLAYTKAVHMLDQHYQHRIAGLLHAASYFLSIAVLRYVVPSSGLLQQLMQAIRAEIVQENLRIDAEVFSGTWTVLQAEMAKYSGSLCENPAIFSGLAQSAGDFGRDFSLFMTTYCSDPTEYVAYFPKALSLFVGLLNNESLRASDKNFRAISDQWNLSVKNSIEALLTVISIDSTRYQPIELTYNDEIIPVILSEAAQRWLDNPVDITKLPVAEKGDVLAYLIVLADQSWVEKKPLERPLWFKAQAQQLFQIYSRQLLAERGFWAISLALLAIGCVMAALIHFAKPYFARSVFKFHPAPVEYIAQENQVQVAKNMQAQAQAATFFNGVLVSFNVALAAATLYLAKAELDYVGLIGAATAFAPMFAVLAYSLVRDTWQQFFLNAYQTALKNLYDSALEGFVAADISGETRADTVVKLTLTDNAFNNRKLLKLLKLLKQAILRAGGEVVSSGINQLTFYQGTLPSEALLAAVPGIEQELVVKRALKRALVSLSRDIQVSHLAQGYQDGHVYAEYELWCSGVDWQTEQAELAPLFNAAFPGINVLFTDYGVSLIHQGQGRVNQRAIQALATKLRAVVAARSLLAPQAPQIEPELGDQAEVAPRKEKRWHQQQLGANGGGGAGQVAPAVPEPVVSFPGYGDYDPANPAVSPMREIENGRHLPGTLFVMMAPGIDQDNWPGGQASFAYFAAQLAAPRMGSNVRVLVGQGVNVHGLLSRQRYAASHEIRSGRRSGFGAQRAYGRLVANSAGQKLLVVDAFSPRH